MKAAYYEANGSARDVLRVGDVPDLPVGPDEVRVRVHVSGVNPSDGYFRAGAFGPIPFPRIIPGRHGAGVIHEIGSGVANRRPGERVWVYNAQWERPFGTAAEYVVLPAARAIPLPVHVSFEQGATLGVIARAAHAPGWCWGSSPAAEPPPRDGCRFRPRLFDHGVQSPFPLPTRSEP